MSLVVRRLALVSSLVACGTQGMRAGPDTSTSPSSPAPPSPSSEVPPASGPPPLVDAGDDLAEAAAPAAPAAPDEDAGPPRVRFVGRFDTSDGAGPWCAWPGCRIVAKFDGTRAAVTLNERVESWMLGGPSEWDVAIDGTLQPKLVLELGTHTYALATDLPRGAHTVELYKRSETQNGYTQFLGLDLQGGTLLPPPLAARRRIEMIGDSQPAAFGVESNGQGPNCPGPNWAARYQNFHLSFAARLGEMFDADVTGSVYSGKGIVRNIYRPDPETMPLVWPRANPVLTDSPFDLASIPPDVILVMLGGNDFAIGQPVDDGLLDPALFEKGYRAFVATLRTTYPRAHVWLASSPSVIDEEPPGRLGRTNVANAIHAIVTGNGDALLHEVSPRLATPDELVGCNGHGTPAFHQRVAEELAVVIRAELGW